MSISYHLLIMSVVQVATAQFASTGIVSLTYVQRVSDKVLLIPCLTTVLFVKSSWKVHEKVHEALNHSLWLYCVVYLFHSWYLHCISPCVTTFGASISAMCRLGPFLLPHDEVGCAIGWSQLFGTGFEIEWMRNLWSMKLTLVQVLVLPTCDESSIGR